MSTLIPIKLKEKWSILAEMSFQINDKQNESSSSSPDGSQSFMSEDKIDKILDWLQDQGVKEGQPESIQLDNQAMQKERLLLKEELLRVEPSLLQRRGIGSKTLIKSLNLNTVNRHNK